VSPQLGPGRLYAKDIAAAFGLSLRQAQRWLAELEIAHGSALVGRVGKGKLRVERFTTRGALANVQPIADVSKVDTSGRVEHLEDEVRQLRQIVSDIGKRLIRVGI
jgi:hypothetical protein